MTDSSNRQAQHRNPALEAAFQLGDWQVDPALNRLVDQHSGEQRHLEPRLMKLLCYLAANDGAVVHRDELVALLWPKVVVNENSLTRAVSDLRKLLDKPGTPARQAVQTIPKRGYRLGITVSSANPLPNSHSKAPSLTTPGISQAQPDRQAGVSADLLRSPWRLVSTGIGASLCLLLALNLSIQPAPSAPETVSTFSDELVFSGADFTDPRFKLSPTGMTEMAADASETPVLSPDRQRFAFIQRDLGASSIYLGTMDGDYQPVQVFSVPYRLSNLTWSPVGNALLFARQDELASAVLFPGSEHSSELMRLDLDSGTVSRLVEATQPAAETSAPESNLT